jgi:DNA polymerase-3 subunit beta
MNITILKNKLLSCLTLIARVTTTNKNLPVLASIHLNAQKDGLELKATNLEIGVILKMRASIKTEGEIIIPVRALLNLVENIKEEKINLKKNKEVITIKTKTCNASINGINSSEFPIVPRIKKNKIASIKGKDISKNLKQVAVAMSFSRARPDLSGVCLIFDKNWIKFIATDGFRLSEKKIVKKAIIREKIKENTIIIPEVGVREIVNMLSSDEDKVDIYLEDNQLALKKEGFYFVSRTIDGKYPNYEQIIPQKENTKIIVEAHELLKKVKLAAFFANNETSDVQIEINPKKNKMQIRAASSNIGEATQKIDGKCSGEEVNVVLNHKYLMDGINSIFDERLKIYFEDSQMPMVLKPVEEEKYSEFLYLISPINKE